MMHRLTPTVIRLYDPNSTRRIVNRVLGLDLSGSYLVVGSDGDADQVALDMGKIDRICKDLGARDLGAEPGEHWWKHRYDFYFPPFAPNLLPKMAGTFETTTTYDRIYDLYLAKKRTIEEDFKDWGADYIAHFSHWFKWGVMVYDRFIIEKPPPGPPRGPAASHRSLGKSGPYIACRGWRTQRPSWRGVQIGVAYARNFTEPHGRPCSASRMPSIPRGS